VNRTIQRIPTRQPRAADLAFWLARPTAKRPVLNRDFKEFAELLNA
jgi:hypothetical protein